ncbi:uncharacterized protein LOC131008977 [Salvia miltiorrhiza]|uniref:uncharacterized protein LOC131008977 n=1 Tax=Salvia miltiorrhiza TaxID=226208 RepID=UPI0025ABC086|nr:uncharacterized protein LOC131008977 [Salvia miltiorrhiza]XP_057792120.1 uncharacterized protein LOC131008977 [Salvia miltiorrhiza]
MKSECFSWITQILNKIRGNNDDYFAYEDETSILLKKRPLLLQPPKPQPRRRRPPILRYFCPKNLRLYIIDGDSEKECKLPGGGFKNATFVASCNGLVLLSSTHRDRIQYGVFNPLSDEAITIIQPPAGIPTPQPCAFFFHPGAKEHRILAVGGKRDPDLGYEYQIYSFQTRRWRPIANPYFRFRPWKSELDSVDGSPAAANGALHWYTGVITVFDVMSEELTVKVLPFVDYLLKLVYFNGYLVTRGEEEELCFCVVGRREAAVEVWVLEDYGKWRWCRKWKIDLSWDASKYPVMEPRCVTASYHVVRVVGFEKDEVVLFWRHRGLFVYNLNFRSVERVWMKKQEMSKDYCRQIYYDHYCGFAPYNVARD